MTNKQTERESMEIYAFGEGMPTSPDVTLLQRTYPDLQVGEKIPYAAIEELIGAKWRTARFRSVTNAWRRKEMDRKGIVIECISGLEFYVANTHQITSTTQDTLSSISRKANRQYKKLSTIKPENDGEKSTRNHQMMLMTVIKREAKKLRMNILPPMEPVKQVQIEPPKAAHE